MFHILQEEGVELKKGCLGHAYFKYLSLSTCASETKRVEEKLFTLIMNKISVLAPINMKELATGKIWIRYSPCIDCVQSLNLYV